MSTSSNIYIEQGANLLKEHGSCLVKGNFRDVFEPLNEIVFKACGTHLTDVLHADIIERESLSVEEARSIKEMANKISRVAGITHVIVVAVSTLTREAQNSLLKVFEEPIESVAMLLVTPHPERLVPTLLSRLVSIQIPIDEKKESEVNQNIDEAAEVFLKAKAPKRITQITEIMKKIESGVWSKKEVAQFISVLKQKAQAVHPESVAIFEMPHTYVLDQSSSVKMLLEYIALKL